MKVAVKPAFLIFCLFGFFLFLTGSFASSSGKRTVSYFSEGDNKIQPFPSDRVDLKPSWIKQRAEMNKEYLLRLDHDRLLHNFRINAGIASSAQPLEGWESPNCGLRGHFTGHYLSACASLAQMGKDTLLLQRLNYIIDALAECQQKLGGKYLSAFPESDFDTLEKKYGGVWAPYYTYHKIMQGLLDIYISTGNKKAYQMALNMADYVKARMDKLTDAEIEKILFTAEANPTNEAGGMNEVLHNLYAVSKLPEHLKLAEIFDRRWFYQSLAEGKDILSGLHSNTHIILVNGYARRYENTGETDFRCAVVNFWDMLINHHGYVNGSSSGPRPVATTPTSRTAEHWGMADHLSATLTGHIAESCVTHNSQRLSSTLFAWTGDPKYADVYMNTFYNAVMAMQNGEDGRTVYHLPLGSPRKKEFLKENDYRCCNGTGIEAFARLNENVYFHDQQNLWVNLYVPSRLQWKEKGITLEQNGNFPEDPRIRFRISTPRLVDFSLHLLIPSWAGPNTKVMLNGQPLRNRIRPLSFLEIDRKWEDGDTIELMFDYPFYLKSMPDNDQVIVVFYGPVLLAFESEKEVILKGDRKGFVQNMIREKDGFAFTLTDNQKIWRLVPFYQVSGQSYGVYATIRNEY